MPEMLRLWSLEQSIFVIYVSLIPLFLCFRARGAFVGAQVMETGRDRFVSVTARSRLWLSVPGQGELPLIPFLRYTVQAWYQNVGRTWTKFGKGTVGGFFFFEGDTRQAGLIRAKKVFALYMTRPTRHTWIICYIQEKATSPRIA